MIAENNLILIKYTTAVYISYTPPITSFEITIYDLFNSSLPTFSINIILLVIYPFSRQNFHLSKSRNQSMNSPIFELFNRLFQNQQPISFNITLFTYNCKILEYETLNFTSSDNYYIVVNFNGSKAI